MINIHIQLNKGVYLPEAYAYRDYLTNQGCTVRLSDETGFENTTDLVIRFMGFRPRLPFRGAGMKAKVIHEYGSLSMPPFARIKDMLKRACNTRPDGRIFLNSFVKHSLGFSDSVPFIFRDMGVDAAFFERRCSNISDGYDIVYSGSERPGLCKVLKKFSLLGFHIMLIGEFSDSFRSSFGMNAQITFTGRLERRYLPDLYNNCRYGLNYVPDVYPYCFQTSTKTLEYCASGLKIISNRCNWIKNFAKERGARFLWFEDHLDRETIDNFDFKTPDVSDLEWNQLLNRIQFKHFLMDIL